MIGLKHNKPGRGALEAMTVSVEEAAKAYNLLFSLPKAQALTSLLLVVCLFMGALSPRLLQGFVAWSLPALLTVILANYLLRSKLFTMKRCIGASTAALLLQALAYLFLTLTCKPLSIYAALVSTSVFTTLHVTVLKALAEQKLLPLTLAPVSFLIASPAYAAAYEVPYLLAVEVMVVSQAIGVTAAYLAIQAIDRLTSIERTGGLKLFKAFAHAWLVDDPSLLEEVASKKSEKVEVEVTSLIFRSREGVRGCFIAFNAHPGPFKNVGGSDLPAMIAERVEERIGGVCMVFHSTATHERDPASRREAEKIVKAALHASITASKLTAPIYTSAACSRSGDPYVICQILGIPLIVMTWRSQRAEDLPSTLGERLKRVAELKGLTPALIIEAHNNFLPVEPRAPNLEEVEARATEALEKALSLKAPRLKAAFMKVSLPWRVDELGRAGVKLALIEVDGKRSAHLLIDANNLSPALHDILLRELSSLGLDFYEVYTTDTHSVVGTRRARGGYRAFGESLDPSQFSSLIRDEVKSLSNCLEEVEVEVGSEKVEVEVLGEQGLASLITTLKRGLILTKVALPLAHIASIAASTLIALTLVA
jgi:putative membrane protein